MENCPRWLDTFIKLARPGSLVAMVGLLILGGFIFASVELFVPEAGARAADVFVGFFRAMDDNYYATLQVFFTTYVLGRSGQAIAKDWAEAKMTEAKEKNVRAS